MSRALNRGSSLCSAQTGELPDSEGLVFALDGVNVVANSATSCNAAGQGVVVNELLSGNDQWREALRLIYAGMPVSAGSNILQRDCASTARQTLVNNWNNLFEGGCAAGVTAGCGDSHPSYNGANTLDRHDPNNVVVTPGIRHAFRRDEASGTSDVFLGLLNLPVIDFAQNAPSGTPSGQTTAYRRLANSPYCNVRRPRDTYPRVIPGPALSGTSNTLNMAPYYPEFQDQDPIRRLCAGRNDSALGGGQPLNRPAEQVCSLDGHLGLVLPINPAAVDPTQSPIPYPNTPCARGSFVLAPIADNANGLPVRCPNNDSPLGTNPGLCFAPATASGDTACLNGKNNAPGVVLDAAAALPDTSTEPADPRVNAGVFADGRVYNLHLRKPDGTYQTINRPNPSAPTGPFIPAQIVGAFYRIHSTRSLDNINPAANPCTRSDATSQLGCLARASKCSIAFASGEAVTQTPGTRGLRVNDVAPSTVTIRALLNGGTVYPFAHKLYVNSIIGFEQILGPDQFAPDSEQELVKCFSTIADATVTQFGLVPLPGDPFCEDVNESTLCPEQFTTNNNACATNPVGIPTRNGTCGNGVLDPGEDCDQANVGNCRTDCTIP
jgi:hypothetical protein